MEGDGRFLRDGTTGVPGPYRRYGCQRICRCFSTRRETRYCKNDRSGQDRGEGLMDWLSEAASALISWVVESVVGLVVGEDSGKQEPTEVKREHTTDY